MDTFDYNAREFRRGRFFYVVEATSEYLVILLVTGSFLARITSELGFSDSLTGIISSFLSCGSLFQLFALLIRKKRVKRITIGMCVLSQLFFMLLYLIPLASLSSQVKTGSFICIIFIAFFVSNVVKPVKINWQMSLVKNGHRGRFTGSKEITSLICGIVFSFVMGYIVDHFGMLKRMNTAFLIFALTIFGLAVLTTLSMVFTIEPEREEVKQEKMTFPESLRKLLNNKNVLLLMCLFSLNSMSQTVATSFLNTYMIKEMAFSQTFIVLLTTVSSVCRIFSTIFLGKYADRKSFAAMATLCFALNSASYLICVFAVPENGSIMLLLYYILNGAAMGGIGNAVLNLVFDYVPHTQRSDMIALSNAVSGVMALFATMTAGKLVSYIQDSGNTFLGIAVYAQQVTALIGMFLAAFAMTLSVIILKKAFVLQKH